MKKYLAIPAALCLAASLLTACGGGKGETTAADTKAEQGRPRRRKKKPPKQRMADRNRLHCGFPGGAVRNALRPRSM